MITDEQYTAGITREREVIAGFIENWHPSRVMWLRMALVEAIRRGEHWEAAPEPAPIPEAGDGYEVPAVDEHEIGGES